MPRYGVMENKSNKSTFRLATRSLFLTYNSPIIVNCLSEKNIFDQLKNILEKRNLKIILFNVSQEINSKNPHYHVFLLLDKKLETRNKKILDLKYGELIFAGNYQTGNRKIKNN